MNRPPLDCGDSGAAFESADRAGTLQRAAVHGLNAGPKSGSQLSMNRTGQCSRGDAEAAETGGGPVPVSPLRVSASPRELLPPPSSP
jgi:hypothetical protein